MTSFNRPSPKVGSALRPGFSRANYDPDDLMDPSFAR